MEYLTKINNFIWMIAAFIIFISGIYFTIDLKFVQFNFKQMFKNLKKSKISKKSISSKTALMMVLAGRVGVGSISGVALAIYTGGVGSIFWMWISALFAVTICFGETVLGIKYKEKDEEKIYKGGPSYYIKKGLNKPKLALIYAIIIIICYAFGFTSIQANTIIRATIGVFQISPVLIAIILSSMILLIIFGGVKKISNVTSKLVPFMIILYLITGAYILCVNYTQINLILKEIIKSAFNFKAISGGFLGTFLVGIQRGIFSNEAGIGTGSIASSIVETSDSKSQGYIQMLGVYITTMLVCTTTAIIIMTSDYNHLILSDINGIEITQYAFKYHLGNLGSNIVFFSIIMFAFSTILTAYYYGESSLKSIYNKITKREIFVLKIVIVLISFFGSIASPKILWTIVDLLSSILVIINVYALLNLRKIIKIEYEK